MAINFNYNYPQVAREAGFKLRQYKDGPIDWRILGSIEIERLLQDQRLEQVDALLAHLSEAPLATILDTNILDSGIAKYFVISQFAIQYLLFCRKFLDETIRELREAHANSQMDVAKLRKSLAEANNEILQLHKKITQIEAIHEVVYPCHMCTKSFISNEALNIHINRRHMARVSNSGAANIGSAVGSNVGGIAERRTDTPASGNTKEREHNDLQLINAIKLELEIKQLKERLNNAERDIRERSAVSSNSRRASIREPPKALKSVAIQSELLETKEQDDGADATLNSISTDSSEVKERKAQLSKLQSKIQEFEVWRESQQVNNEECIAEINRKLGEIVHTLEETKATPVTIITPVEPKANHKAANADADAAAQQRRGSPSVEDLERLLTQKVVEIGQKSAEKLEEFVQTMENNYKEKLDELEREIKKCNQAEFARVKVVKDTAIATAEMKTAGEETLPLTAPTPEMNALPHNITYTVDAVDPTESDSSLSTEPKPEPAKRMPRIKCNPIPVPELDVIDKAANNDETYVINESGHKQKTTLVKPKPSARKHRNVETALSNKKKSLGEDLYSLSTESNRTFVKAEKADAMVKDKESQKSPIDAKENDSTDITETLSSESESEGSSSNTEPEPLPTAPVKLKQKIKLKEPLKQKPFTRNNAQQMLNKRLFAIGLEPKSNSITTAAMKRLNAELADKRHKLKQKYPNFYATRNKIKKLVDKLCSTQLPAPVEDMLKHNKPIKPRTTYDVQLQESIPLSSNADSFETLEVTSTPIQTPQSLHENDAFKQRLERILASPMRRPNFDDGRVSEQLTTAQVHALPKGAPIPLTRKRVMFNTLSQSATVSGATSEVEPGTRKATANELM
ncbi:cilium assembly protein DZIP1L [Anastrepha obliqua]|uniref:cilium assembly protein DZIP1L n=1 Tax=Anastrepha obliqua TaxID=95512 RepID=UPI0024097177|nr:cilium assembly protein DZIP1L [Anastrepha obliqua]